MRRAPRPAPELPLLALDAGSPLVSVAVGRQGSVLATASGEIRRPSGELLPMIEETLHQAKLGRGDLGGIVCLRGPGSFTGLRVGLATAVGLSDTLEIPALALPTLPVLALAAALAEPLPDARSGLALHAAVDAIRGEWFVQSFAPREASCSGAGGATTRRRGETRLEALGEPRLLTTDGLLELTEQEGACRVVGFGMRAAVGSRGGVVLEPGPLAPVALRHVWSQPVADWDPGLLVRPLYLRQPAVSRPKPEPAATLG